MYCHGRYFGFHLTAGFRARNLALDIVFYPTYQALYDILSLSSLWCLLIDECPRFLFHDYLLHHNA